MKINDVTVVKTMPTAIWIESGMMGERSVMVQHEGCEPFEYAIFHYDYRYTSNAGTHAAAEEMARALGAVDPIAHKNRACKKPDANEIREAIKGLQEMLQDINGQLPHPEGWSLEGQ